MALQITPKFTYHRPSKSACSFHQTARAWSGHNTYRTHYNDMSTKVGRTQSQTQVQRKSYVIPGYSGHIPKQSGLNMFGKTMSQISRECFKKEAEEDDTPDFCSTFGSSWKEEVRKDRTLQSRCHRYGRQTIPKPHPAMNEEWSTTARSSWQTPKKLPPPHLRVRSIDLDEYYENQVGTPNVTASDRLFTRVSGFVQNSTLFDGTTWNPDQHLHTDQIRTEYRKHFNQPKPFHKDFHKGHHALLKPRQLVYDNDEQGKKVPKQLKLMLTSPNVIKKIYGNQRV